MKNIGIFGSTGSIGVNSLEVIREYPKLFRITCLTANKNINLLLKQAEEFNPKIIVITNEKAYKEFISKSGIKAKVFCGEESLNEVLTLGKIDVLVNSLVGFSGLKPTITAIQNKIEVALANKESLVTAGEIIMPLLKEKKVNLLPIDSEHSAILQCLVGENKKEVNKIILTASGGPFFRKEKEDFHKITIEEALNHPNWKMGNKITIDSATLINKGLEVIEARWLFDIPASRIEVVIHPQSIIHSMVEFVDGSVKAQLGVPDMKIPIQYALTYPKRLPIKMHRLDFIKTRELHFFEPDLDKFECLNLAYKALEIGGTTPTVLNAANEIAVHMFLTGKIKFIQIPELIKDAIDKFPTKKNITLENIFITDHLVREYLNEKY